MAHIVETQIDTPAAELRQRLERAERQLPTLAAGQLGDYLRSLDRIEQLFSELAADSADVRPELTRWEDLQARLGNRATRLLKLANAEGGMAALRAANPPADGVWWRLDELVAEDRKRSWTRWAAILTVAALVLALAAFVYNRWLAPSPEVSLVMGTISQVEQLVEDENWDQAAALAEQTLQTTPDDPDLLVWAAVLAERRGRAEEAAAYLARAEQTGVDPLRLQLTLGMRRLQAGDVDGAEAAAHAAQTISPDDAQAVFLLGNVAEERGEVEEALALFQQASDLAEQQDNGQLTVVARMRYGMLLQQLQYGPPDGTGESTGESTGEATDEAPDASTELPAEVPTVTPAP